MRSEMLGKRRSRAQGVTPLCAETLVSPRESSSPSQGVEQENACLVPPMPLRRDLSGSPEFPCEALGQVLGRAAMALHGLIQAPLALCGNAVLGAAALAVQGHADVEIPGAGRRPVSLFLVTVAASGERKTTADGQALQAIHEYERELAVRYDQKREEWRVSQTAWEASAADIRRNRKRYPTREAREDGLRKLGPPPPPPLLPLLTCGEPTWEGLTGLMRDGQASLGLFSSEGGQFIGGHAMNEENRLKTAAGLSGLWDGGSITRVRRGDGAFALHGRRLSVHLQVQPQAALGLLADPVLRDQGLLSRLLVAAPDSTAGTRFWREPSHEVLGRMSDYHSHLANLLRLPLPLVDGTRNTLTPRVLPPSVDALRHWVAFANDVERGLASEGRYAGVRAFAAKLAEHAARLAAIVALVDNPSVDNIGAEDMNCGITLAGYYAAEAVRLQEAGADNPDLVLAERLLSWLQATWAKPLVSLPDIYQLGPVRAIRDKATAQRIVNILEQHGWLEPVDGPVEVAGKRRRTAWHIVSAVEAQP